MIHPGEDSPLRPCPACSHPIARGARRCPQCGKTFTTALSWIGAVLIGLLIAVVLCAPLISS